MSESTISGWRRHWFPKWPARGQPKPRQPAGRKPRDMLYTVDDSPPLRVTLTMGAQHALLALMLSVYAVIAAQSIGLSGGAVQEFVATCILIAGVGTLLQASGTVLGSGQLAVHIPTPITLGTFVAVAGTLGIEAAAGGLLIAGMVVLLLSKALPQLRTLFPPEVAGVVVTMLGLSLVQGGVERSLGLSALEPMPDASAVLVAGLTLLPIIGLSIWGGPRWRSYAVLVGVVIGYGCATALGLGDAVPRVADEPVGLFHLPIAAIPWPVLALAAAVPMVMAEVVNAVDSFGNFLTLDKMNDADWRRADLPMVSRGILAQGITTLLSGITGTQSTGVSSANIGLAFATGIAARRVGLVAGLVLLFAAFVPHISALIANTPRAVVGAILIYASGYLIVAGMELILSRLLNPRRIFVVGFAIVAGMAIIVLPRLPESAPAWLEPLLASSLAVASFVAVVLNVVLRIGVKQRAACTIPDQGALAAIQDFVDMQGATWGARRIVISRVAHSLGEAIELIAPLRAGQAAPVRLEAAFDEFFLEFTLRYQGAALALDGDLEPAERLAELLESGDIETLERALDSLPMMMLKRLADRIRAGQQGETAYLRLIFEH